MSPIIFTFSGPTGRTITRQTEAHGRQQHHELQRKIDNSSLPGHLQSEKNVEKFGKYPQSAEIPIASQFPVKSQHSMKRDGDLFKESPSQEQQLQQHIQREGKDSASNRYPFKSQQQLTQQQQKFEQQQEKQSQHTKKQLIAQELRQSLSKQNTDVDSHDGPPLSTQRLEKKQLELLDEREVKEKQVSSLQKSPTNDISAQKQSPAYDPQNQRYQQLVRAGSLGSGEPTAILEKRRSRSPLRTPGQAHPISTIREGKYISSVSSIPLSEKVREKAFHVDGERKRTVKQDISNWGDKSYSQLPKSVDKSQSRASDASKSIHALGGPAAADVRTGVIRAAAKAYTENFHSYSFSGYLTKSRRDSGVKITPLMRENTETEVTHPLGFSDQQDTDDQPHAEDLESTHSYTGRTQQSGKIIVPLTSFVLASKSSEPVTNLDKVVIKQPLSGATAVVKVNAPGIKENPVIGNKEGYKVDQGRETGECDGQHNCSATPHTQPKVVQQNHSDQQSKDTPSKNIIQDKHITNPSLICRGPPTFILPSVNKKTQKNLPPFVSGLRHHLGGDKMKGNNEGALLVACRIGEEDQVLRLIKELTSAGVLDATVLNQADRSGRVSKPSFSAFVNVCLQENLLKSSFMFSSVYFFVTLFYMYH